MLINFLLSFLIIKQLPTLEDLIYYLLKRKINEYYNSHTFTCTCWCSCSSTCTCTPPPRCATSWFGYPRCERCECSQDGSAAMDTCDPVGQLSYSTSSSLPISPVLLPLFSASIFSSCASIFPSCFTSRPCFSQMDNRYSVSCWPFVHINSC